MKKKFFQLIKRGNLDELKGFFSKLSDKEVLDIEEELLRPEQFNPKVVKIFVRYFVQSRKENCKESLLPCFSAFTFY